MNVNAKALSELRRLEQGLIAASTPFYMCTPTINYVGRIE